MTKEKTLNLYQKIVEIRKEVEYIQKGSKGYNFVYADESALLGRIREKMDELGVVLETDMKSLRDIQQESIDTEDRFVSKNRGVEAHFEFTWVNAENPSDRISKNIFLRSDKYDAQTIGGLMTYAHRYFLYKNLSIPTDKDDPDAFDKKMGKVEYLSKAQQDYIKKLVGNDEALRARVLDAASKRQGSKVSQYSEIIEEMYDYLVKSIKKIQEGGKS